LTSPGRSRTGAGGAVTSAPHPRWPAQLRARNGRWLRGGSSRAAPAQRPVGAAFGIEPRRQPDEATAEDPTW